MPRGKIQQIFRKHANSRLELIGATLKQESGMTKTLKK